MVSYQRAAAHVSRCPQCDAEVRAQMVARSWLRSAEAPAMPTSLLDGLRSIPVALPATDNRPAPDNRPGPTTGPRPTITRHRVNGPAGDTASCAASSQCPAQPPVSFPGHGCAGRGTDGGRAGRGRAHSGTRRSPGQPAGCPCQPGDRTAGRHRRVGHSVAVPADDNRAVPNGSPSNGSPSNGSPSYGSPSYGSPSYGSPGRGRPPAPVEVPPLDPVQVGAYARPGGVDGSFGPRPQRGPVALGAPPVPEYLADAFGRAPGNRASGSRPRRRSRHPNHPPRTRGGSGVGRATGPARPYPATARHRAAGARVPSGPGEGRRAQLRARRRLPPRVLGGWFGWRERRRGRLPDARFPWRPTEGIGEVLGHGRSAEGDRSALRPGAE